MKKHIFTNCEYGKHYKQFVILAKKHKVKVHDYEQFKKHLDKFIELTFDAYILGEGSRIAAWNKWRKYIGSLEMANIYFEAVDNTHPYT